MSARKEAWPRAGLVLGWLALAGCGSGGSGPEDPSQRHAQQSMEYYQKAEEDRIAGFDPLGFPVYGADEEGKPIYKKPMK